MNDYINLSVTIFCDNKVYSVEPWQYEMCELDFLAKRVLRKYKHLSENLKDIDATTCSMRILISETKWVNLAIKRGILEIDFNISDEKDSLLFQAHDGDEIQISLFLEKFNALIID